MLKELAEQTKKTEKPWSIKRGPEPGLKYRGGSPPDPPPWAYHRSDIQAFQRWEKKLTVWRRQISSYVPPNEAAMRLFVSLQGEAEQELEWCDIDKVDHEDGISYIVETLRAPLMVKGIYLKRKYLDDFERLNRRNGESIKSFTNRYHRTERSLQSVGVSIQAMYDQEASGSRLLDRMRLGLEAQRLILVATGQSLKYQDVKEAAELQFPEHRPVPAVVYTRDFDTGPKDDRENNKIDTRKPKGSSKGKGKTKDGKGKSSTFTRSYNTTYMTEIPEEPDQESEPPEEGGHDEDEAQAEEQTNEECEEPSMDYDTGNEEPGEEDLALAAHCLTVTARRLSGLKLGRKFTTGKSVAQRKAESHCAACGTKGHWQGDPECPQSSSSTSKGSDKRDQAKGGGKSKDKSSAKKVLTVQQPGGGTREVTFGDPINEETYGTFFTYVVSLPSSPPCDIEPYMVFGNNLKNFSHYLVLDTACQRTCCSTTWLQCWEEHVHHLRLKPKTTSSHEPFEFGHGPPQYSKLHAYLPCCFDSSPSTCCLLGTSVLDTANDIPLLGSNVLLKEKLKATLDLPNQRAHLDGLKCSVPIVLLNGHLALDIASFPLHVHTHDVWKSLSSMVEQACDAEFVTTEKHRLEPHLHRPPYAADTAKVVAGMAARGESPQARRDPLGPCLGASDPAGHPRPRVAGMSRPPLHGGEGAASEDCPRTVRAQASDSLREQAWQLQQMPGLRKEVEVGPRLGKVGRANVKKGLCAAALTVLLQHGHELCGHTAYPSSPHGPQHPAAQLHSTFPVLSEYVGTTIEPCASTCSPGHSGIDPLVHPGIDGSLQERNEASEAQAKGRDRDLQRGLGRQLRLGESSGAHSMSSTATPPMSSSMNASGPTTAFGTTSTTMKKGTKAWLTGHLRQVSKTMDRELQVYKSMPTHLDYKKSGSKADCMVLDLLEVFAGTAKVSELAPRFGLSAVQPFDLIYDIDLKTEHGKQLLIQAVQKLKPLLLLVAWPCGPWSIFNQNMNYSRRPEELEAVREQERPLVELGARLCQEQDREGRLYLGENPLRSALWQEPSIQNVRNLANNLEVTCDAGAYGAETSDGWPIQKPHKWVTNSQPIAQRLQHRLTEEQKYYTKAIEGKDTKASGEYCNGLACAILEGLQEEARQRNPQRFHVYRTHNLPKYDNGANNTLANDQVTTLPMTTNKVYYVAPSSDLQRWGELLDEIERRFMNTFKRPFYINEGDALMAEIQNLVPWEITQVQATWTPAARRLPLNFPYTHRGCVFRTTSGNVGIEHEDLGAIAYPKQRFLEPIRVALFIYGIAPDDAAEEAPDEHTEADGLHDTEPPQAPTVTRRVPGLSTDIRFEGGPPMTRQMQTSVARLHCNLGHASKTEIIRILAAAGKLDSKIVSALDALRCGSCERMSKAFKPPPSSTSTTSRYSGAFGDHIQCDIIYIRLLSGKAVPVLGMICLSTNYHAAKVLTDRSPGTILDTMHEIWYRPFGLPISVQLDSDGAFLSTTQEWHVNIGIEYLVIPAEEAWQLGKIGRRNALMRALAERLVDENGATTKEHLDLILTAVLNSMNTSTYSYGRSPCQAVFGRIPRPVGDIFSDSKALSISPQPHPEQLGLHPELLRAEALTALAQLSASQAVKRALLRKTNVATDLHYLEPGQAVAYWRQSGKARQHKKGSWNLSRFLAWDPDGKSAWVQVGRHSVKVGSTQLRPAAGWENWTPSQEDLELIKQADHNMAAGLWLDDTGDPPDDEMKGNIEDELFQFRPSKIQRITEPAAEQTAGTPAPEFKPEQAGEQPPAELVSPQPYTMATLPTSGSTALQPAQTGDIHMHQHNTVEQQMRTNQTVNMHTDQRQITVNIDSPTYQQYGPNVSFGPLPPTPRSIRARSHPRSQPYTPTMVLDQEQRPAPETPALVDTQGDTAQALDNIQTAAAAEATADTAAAEHTTAPAEADTSASQVLNTSPMDDLIEQLDIYDDNTATLRAPHWDGSPDMQSTLKPCKQFYKAYLTSNKRQQDMAESNIIQNINQSDSESSDEDLAKSNNRTMTRQEAKQLDREIPWQEIVLMPRAAFEKFVESARGEFSGWTDWSTIRPLSNSETKSVRSDPQLCRRIVKSRAAYKDKSRGQGPLRAKTRVVLIGCQDPDLRNLTRDSPTPTRLSEFIILCVATAGANREFNHDQCKWHLWLSDAEKAFLQGKQDTTERGGLPIFMESPRDPILLEAGAFPAELYEVTGNCYGLSNAPRVWYSHVDKTVKAADFKQHSFDRCFYYHLNEDNVLDCLLICHVDDFMATYSETFDLNKLEGLFSWGSTTKISPETQGEYRGKEIIMVHEDGKYKYKVSQKTFCDNLQSGKVPKSRLQEPERLTPDEVKEFRSVVGCLQWLGGQSRPELCAVTSLTHHGPASTIHDLKLLYEVLDYVKSTASEGITFPAVPLNKASTIVTFADSSWANCDSYKSQYGVLVTICPPQVTQVTTSALLLDWKSGRSPRICRSTLAAEACASDEGADRAAFVNLFLTEVFYQKPAFEGHMRLSSLMCTDAKSLYDCLVAENPALTDKRSMVQIRSVQEHYMPKDVRWLPTTLQHADGLTKVDATLMTNLRKWCSSPWAQLVEQRLV